MPVIDNTTEEERFELTDFRPSEEEIKRVRNLIPVMFLSRTDMQQKRNIIRYREQRQGIDHSWYEVFGLDANKDAILTMAGLTSMMVYSFTQITAGRFFSTFASDIGDYVKVLPQRISAIESSKALEHLINYYLRQDKYFKHTLYDLYVGTSTDGVGITEQSWNYRTTTRKRNRLPRQKWDVKEKTFRNVNDLTVLETLPLIDRPQLRYIDPLMFGVPPGTRRLNEDASMCCHKDIFTRAQLLGMEKRGYVYDFKKLSKSELGESRGSSLEAPEMRLYYQDLFSQSLNERLEWDDPEYRYIVDKVFIAPNDEEDIQVYWFVNGNCIKHSTWEGGHELPYVIHNFTPTLTSWLGMGIPEIIQDYYREDNIMTRQSVTIARKAGKLSLMIPRDSNITQRDIAKLTEEGGVVQYDDTRDGIPFNQKVIQYNLGAPLDGLLKPRDDVRTQAGIAAGIAISEIAGADLPSALRSDKLLAGLGAQGSRPAQMQVSLMGESMSQSYEQIKNLIYRLQQEPVEVYLGDAQTPIVQIDPETMDRLPDCLVVPNTFGKKLSSDMFQILVQMLPYIQSASSPVAPDQAYNFGKVLDFVLESAMGPEEVKKLDTTKGTGLPTTFTDMAQQQGQSPGGNNRVPNAGPKPLGM